MEISLWQTILLLALLVVCSFGPGLWAMRFFQWSPTEKLGGAMGFSFIFLYVAGFALFWFHAGSWGYYAISGLCLAAGFLGRGQLRILLSNRQSRGILIAFAILLAWEFGHLMMVQHINAGFWGDWSEHYERMSVFLRILPVDASFLPPWNYQLPARPPMFNVIVAFFCRQAGTSYQAYSLASLWLNAFAFVPCCLLARQIATKWGAHHVTAVLMILFMLNPSILQNATYAWTKAFSAGLLILGVSFYLRGLRRSDASRMIVAFLFLSSAILAHYSAVPYAMAIGVHYGWTLLSARRRWIEPLIAVSLAGTLLLTWFAWSISIFGRKDTFFSNTTAEGMAGSSDAQRIHVVLTNLLTTLVPHPFTTPVPQGYWSSYFLQHLRDYYFAMAQFELPTMIGFTSWIILVILLYRRFRYGKSISWDIRLFWILFALFGLLLGTATNAVVMPFGTGHVTSQPLALIGVVFIAANFNLLRSMEFALLFCGLIIDYSLGILLHFQIQTTDYNSADADLKAAHGYLYWGDALAGLSPYMLIGSITIAVIALWCLRRLHIAHRPAVA